MVVGQPALIHNRIADSDEPGSPAWTRLPRSVLHSPTHRQRQTGYERVGRNGLYMEEAERF